MSMTKKSFDSPQEPLHDARTRFFAAFDPVVILDHNYRIIDVNDRFLELYCLSREEAIGYPCYQITHRRSKPCGTSAHPCPFTKVFKSRSPSRAEHIHIGSRGNKLYHELFYYPLLDESQRVEYVVEVIRDITHDKMAEAIIKKDAERLEFILDLQSRASLLSETQIYDIVIQKAVELTDSKIGCLHIVNESEQIFPLTLWDRKTFKHVANGQSDPSSWAAACQECVHSKQVVIHNELPNPPRSTGRQARKTLPVRQLSLPLLVNGQVQMVIGVGNKPDKYDETDVAQLQFVIKELESLIAHKRADREKNRLVNAIACSVDGIAITDKDDRYTYVNEAHAAIYGYKPEELIGKTWKDLVPKGVAISGEKIVQERLHSREFGMMSGEFMALRKDGSQSLTEVKARALWTDEGQYSGHICIVVDVSDRKQMEADKDRRAAELNTIVRVSASLRKAQTSEEMIRVVLTQITELFDADRAALGILDATSNEITVQQGWGAWEAWTGQHQIASGMAAEAIRENRPALKELSTDEIFETLPNLEDIRHVACLPLCVNGKAIGVLWLGRRSPIPDNDLRLLQAIADIVANGFQRQSLHENLKARLKDLQDTQLQLIQQEKLAAIGQLISGIAHELNNPLTSVILYAQMMQKRSDDEKTKRDLDKIVDEALRASQTVRGLLDFARHRSAERRTTSINDIVKSAVSFVSGELRVHNIQSQLKLSTDVPFTMADPHQLQQVLINLITNSWQAISETQSGGHIWIATETGRPLYKGNQSDRTIARIIVKDDGPGIPIESRLRVFDPFFTTKPEGIGTGLGLSICHGIISGHGGQIWVEGEEGQGATFIIELPITSPGLGNGVAKQNTIVSEVGGNSRILIIDDEAGVLEVLARALTGKGYHVDAVSNAFDGMEKIRQADYAMILCDIRMPEINGPTFYQEVKAQKPDLVKHIVFITGDLVTASTQTFIKEENVLCLAKPFGLDDLLGVISLVGADKPEGKGKIGEHTRLDLRTSWQ